MYTGTRLEAQTGKGGFTKFLTVQVALRIGAQVAVFQEVPPMTRTFPNFWWKLALYQQQQWPRRL